VPAGAVPKPARAFDAFCGHNVDARVPFLDQSLADTQTCLTFGRGEVGSNALLGKAAIS
jgi:hypothetical protein